MNTRGDHTHAGYIWGMGVYIVEVLHRLGFVLLTSFGGC